MLHQVTTNGESNGLVAALLPKKFRIVLIKPSKYDDDGYVIRFWKGVLPSNTLNVLHGLTDDVRRRRVFGKPVPNGRAARAPRGQNTGLSRAAGSRFGPMNSLRKLARLCGRMARISFTNPRRLSHVFGVALVASEGAWIALAGLAIGVVACVGQYSHVHRTGRIPNVTLPELAAFVARYVVHSLAADEHAATQAFRVARATVTA